MPPGDWARIEGIARAHHWNVDKPGRWTMVLYRAKRSITLYFDSETGDIARAFAGGREMKARNARLMAARVITLLGTDG